MPKVSEFAQLTRLGTGVRLAAAGERLVPPYLLYDGVTVSHNVFSPGGTHRAGTLTGGSWTQRPLNAALNSIVGVPSGLPSWFTATLPTFTITSGYYLFEGWACAYGVDSHICALRLVALAGLPLIVGCPGNSCATNPSMTRSVFSLAAYLDASYEFDMGQFCKTTCAFDGMGVTYDLGFASQRFAEVKITRLD
jgi:hypothetical protein